MPEITTDDTVLLEIWYSTAVCREEARKIWKILGGMQLLAKMGIDEV
jgi:hypothetical protein